MAERDDFMEHFSLEDIPEEDLDAVRRYISTDFRIVDSALRRFDQPRSEELDAFILLVTYGLFQLPSFRGAVYRGTTLSDTAAGHYLPGAIVFEPSFVIATGDPARRFPGNTTFVIASINGRDVSLIAETPEEKEVVFFSGTRFEVLAAEHDARTDDRYIYLAEIPDRRLLQALPANY